VTGNCFDDVHEFRQLRSQSSSSSLTLTQPLMGNATPDATKVRLKLHFNEEIRVLVVNKTLPFDELLAKLREQYDRTISFRYMDEENDLITVRCEDDWQEALSFYLRTNLQTFKVFLDDGTTLRKSRSRVSLRDREIALRVVAIPPSANRHSPPSANRYSGEKGEKQKSVFFFDGFV
jgi:hypothetical protein